MTVVLGNTLTVIVGHPEAPRSISNRRVTDGMSPHDMRMRFF